MIDNYNTFVYPLNLKVGDRLIDKRTGEEYPVKDISIYTTILDKDYKRINWIYAGNAIFNFEVLFKKFKNRNNNMLEIIPLEG
jgi:hypothetical protein